MYNGLLGRYKNGNYEVSIYSDGTKIRDTSEDEFIPAFPESIDIHISSRCDNNCPYCYADCSPDGKFGNLLDWKFLETIHPYTEVALNLQMPVSEQLIPFLRLLKEKKVIPNITVNQNHFMNLAMRRYIDDLYEENLIYGLGISLTNPSEDFIQAVKHYPNAVIHVINGVVTESQMRKLFNKGLKILILGYKTLGRGIDYKNVAFHNEDNLIVQNQNWMYSHLSSIMLSFDIVSFDNLAIDQLDVRRVVSDDDWEISFMGQDSMYTFYMNLVDGTYSTSSLSLVKYTIGDKSIDEMFMSIRGKGVHDGGVK